MCERVDGCAAFKRRRPQVRKHTYRQVQLGGLPAVYQCRDALDHVLLRFCGRMAHVSLVLHHLRNPA